MPEMINNIEDYFTRGCGRCERFGTPECSTKQWQLGLARLRRICLDMGLAETLKWGHPCYIHAGRNIVIIGAHRGDFRLSFFDAALMKDPEGILEKAGPNTQHAHMFSFERNEQVDELEPVIRAYITEAKEYAAAGIKPPQTKQYIDIPEELVEAMDCDPELAEAFHALTPGRQRSYAINLNAAKRPETRRTRIEKLRPKILAGKGAVER